MPNEMIVSVFLHIVLQAQHFIPSVIVLSSSVHLEMQHIAYMELSSIVLFVDVVTSDVMVILVLVKW